MLTDFQEESLTDEWLEEAMPLLVLHWREIAHYQDLMLEPDLSVYRKAEENGMLKVFTVRDTTSHVLLGYALFFVRNNPHYASSLQAVQDILFIRPEARGNTGRRFIQWCDQRLTAMGVQAVYHHVKATHNFGPLLERMGYKLVDLIYTRRLD